MISNTNSTRTGRSQAIALVTRIGLACNLNLNFLPRRLELCADAIGTTCKAAADNALPLERITLEVTEGEVIHDHAHFAALLNEYRGMGIKLAIDDFGADSLWSDSRGKERRGNFCKTLIFAQRNGEYRQVQLRLLLPRQATMESIPASLKGLRR